MIDDINCDDEFIKNSIEDIHEHCAKLLKSLLLARESEQVETRYREYIKVNNLKNDIIFDYLSTRVFNVVENNSDTKH